MSPPLSTTAYHSCHASKASSSITFQFVSAETKRYCMFGLQGWLAIDIRDIRSEIIHNEETNVLAVLGFVSSFK